MKKPKLTALDAKTMSSDKDMREFYIAMEIDVLARTLWGEARGEGSVGMRAVASVVLNRVKFAQKKGKYWWGNNIIQVCQKPYQFSCWNRSDPNFKQLQKIDERSPYFASAVAIAKFAIRGELEDQTGSATHYHALGIDPYWARREKPSAVIGRHIFYRLY